MSELLPGLMVTSTVRLERPLGEGGMGSVWVAEHLALKTTVVVKFMSKELAANADAVERFSREAAAAAQVKSPHVVHTLDYGVTAENVPYIVMELLDGHDLAEQLRQTPVLPPTEVAGIVSQAAKALARAHAVGIVHRDIKPDNIFLCDADGGDVFVKLLDFGIAKSTQALGTGTRTGSIIGTPSYMSPEQITGAKIDHRTDVWSLGAVAFEAMTGRRPYDGDNVGAIALAIHGVPPVPSAVNSALSPAIDAWFARACAVDVEKRFSSAKDLAQALTQAISGVASVPRVLSIRPRSGAPATGPSELDEASRHRSATQLGASVAATVEEPTRSPLKIVVA
ncbi:MAG: serine/threonine-protein kinase, partial [Polyangiaceae bacterium]